jgi:hypothetical protein
MSVLVSRRSWRADIWQVTGDIEGHFTSAASLYSICNQPRGFIIALFQLIYMSSLAKDEPSLLPSIVDVSVRRNKLRSITGMLLYADGSILQVLEGEKEVVHEAFQIIELDERHSGIFVLIEQEIAARQFASWSMGFKQLSKLDLAKFPAAVPMFKARQDEISLRSRAGEALTLLQSFADGSMSAI